MGNSVKRYDKSSPTYSIYTTHYTVWTTRHSFFYASLGFIYPKTWLYKCKAWMLTLHIWCRHSSYWLMCIDSRQRPVRALPVAMDLMTVSVKAPPACSPLLPSLFSKVSGKQQLASESLSSHFTFSWECQLCVFLYCYLTEAEPFLYGLVAFTEEDA